MVNHSKTIILQLVLLRSLKQRAKHAYPLTLEVRVKFNLDVAISSVYEELYNFRRKGYVTSKWESPTNTRESTKTRNVYAITQNGLSELKNLEETIKRVLF